MSDFADDLSGNLGQFDLSALVSGAPPPTVDDPDVSALLAGGAHSAGGVDPSVLPQPQPDLSALLSPTQEQLDHASPPDFSPAPLRPEPVQRQPQPAVAPPARRGASPMGILRGAERQAAREETDAGIEFAQSRERLEASEMRQAEGERDIAMRQADGMSRVADIESETVAAVDARERARLKAQEAGQARVMQQQQQVDKVREDMLAAQLAKPELTTSQKVGNALSLAFFAIADANMALATGRPGTAMQGAMDQIDREFAREAQRLQQEVENKQTALSGLERGVQELRQLTGDDNDAALLTEANMWRQAAKRSEAIAQRAKSDEVRNRASLFVEQAEAKAAEREMQVSASMLDRARAKHDSLEGAVLQSSVRAAAGPGPAEKDSTPVGLRVIDQGREFSSKDRSQAQEIASGYNQFESAVKNLENRDTSLGPNERRQAAFEMVAAAQTAKKLFGNDAISKEEFQVFNDALQNPTEVSLSNAQRTLRNARRVGKGLTNAKLRPFNVTLDDPDEVVEGRVE